MKVCHDYVETINLSWEKLNRDHDALRARCAKAEAERDELRYEAGLLLPSDAGERLAREGKTVWELVAIKKAARALLDGLHPHWTPSHLAKALEELL